MKVFLKYCIFCLKTYVLFHFDPPQITSYHSSHHIFVQCKCYIAGVNPYLSLSLSKEKKENSSQQASRNASSNFFFLSVPYSCSGREQHKRKSRVLFIKPSLAATQFHAVCTLPLGCPGRMKHASLLIAPV